MSKEFGRFLSRLRRQRYGLTQQGLINKEAMRNSVSLKSLQDLEQGRIAHIDPQLHLNNLAEAFNLDIDSKVAFYSLAGLVYPKTEEPLDRDLLLEIFSKIPYPAIAKTPLWDIVCFNSMYSVVFGYDQEIIQSLESNRAGSNLLYPLFDSVNPRLQNSVNRNKAVKLFQIDSLPYIESHRYGQIITHMMKFASFQDTWYRMLNYTENVGPINKFIYPKLGTIEFVSLQVSPQGLGGNLNIEINFPISNILTYQQLINNTEDLEKVYIFEKNF